MQPTDGEQSEITAFGKARERFLMEAFPEVYKKMKADGSLEAHLKDVGEEAQTLFNSTVAQIRSKAHKDNLPFLELAKTLQQAPVIASELVMHDVILTPPSSQQPSKPKKNAKPVVAPTTELPMKTKSA